MGKGRGKGKGRSGGGKLYVTNIEELQLRDAQVKHSQAVRKNRRGESDDEDEVDEDNVSDDGVVFESEGDDIRELVNNERASRLKKAGDEDEEKVEVKEKKIGFDVNLVMNSSKQGKSKRVEYDDDDDSPPELTRRQREELEKQKREAEYRRKHAAGETEEAKADLARLAEVRKRREEARLKREKEEARKKREEEGIFENSDEDDSGDDEERGPKVSAEKKAAISKKKKAAMEEDTTDDIPILTSIEIKKLKPDQLKGHLKQRGLPIQGQKKELITRLTEYEKTRK